MSAPAPKRHAKRKAQQSAAPAILYPPVPTEATTSDVPAAQWDEEDVARLAYSYWEARGCEGGSPEEDWLRAEQQLKGA